MLVTGCSAASSSPAPTVAVRDLPGVGVILVDMDDSTLYVADEERGGVVQCTGACAITWPPLTVPRGASPVAGEGVQGRLATLVRSDGAVQVTYDGQPLYLFSRDTGPGIAKGNGLTDSSLTWHVAMPGASAPAAWPGGVAGWRRGREVRRPTADAGRVRSAAPGRPP
jgi:predicted lipoprotein with Yx(FWY)xxD motif